MRKGRPDASTGERGGLVHLAWPGARPIALANCGPWPLLQVIAARPGSPIGMPLGPGHRGRALRRSTHGLGSRRTEMVRVPDRGAIRTLSRSPEPRPYRTLAGQPDRPHRVGGRGPKRSCGSDVDGDPPSFHPRPSGHGAIPVWRSPRYRSGSLSKREGREHGRRWPPPASFGEVTFCGSDARPLGERPRRRRSVHRQRARRVRGAGVPRRYGTEGICPVRY